MFTSIFLNNTKYAYVVVIIGPIWYALYASSHIILIKATNVAS